MIDVNKLRGKIAERGFSQRELAKILGMSDMTFYRKMRKGRFESDEIEEMIVLLKIENPMEIFFTKVGA